MQILCGFAATGKAEKHATRFYSHSSRRRRNFAGQNRDTQQLESVRYRGNQHARSLGMFLAKSIEAGKMVPEMCGILASW